MPGRIKYNAVWPDGTDDAQIECGCIRKGEKWIKSHGNTEFFHYRNLFRLFWPEDDEHRWEDEELRAILSNQFVTLMGASGSVKTTTAAKYALALYACWPRQTTILVSSTDLRGLELRVFGRIKGLLDRARNRYPWFPGHVLDSKKAIATDDIEENEVRDLKDGLTCVPCLSSTGGFVGLGKYIGIHNTRLLFVGDEFQLMRLSLLDAIPNLMNNPWTKFLFLGNPLAQNDPLDRVSEPKDGWSSIGIPTKTTTWRTKYMNGVCLCLPGLDSPNFDYPADQPDRFPYMVSRRKAALVANTYGEGSQQYCSQILGVRVAGLTARKVITAEICEKFGAFNKPVWRGETTKIYAIDAAYGSIGGDLCVGGWIEFGQDPDGKQILAVGVHKTIPVSSLSKVPPDDQIADYVKADCEELGIEQKNVFYDGRTLLAAAFARIWNDPCNPVDFGGRTTARPVAHGVNILDPITGQTRPKLCKEHYSKFVTELWFSIRYTIESGQFRNMDDEILDDAIPREWKTVRGNLIEVESKKDMKKRTGKSPDVTDWLAAAVEGARRRGFMISKLAQGATGKGTSEWLEELEEERREFMESRQLQEF